MPRSFSKFFIASFWLFLGLPLLHALDIQNAFTLDLPFQANAATPSWLGHPDAPATTFATLNLPIQPPDTTSSLLVTIFFQEKEGGFLRLTWNGPQGAQTLSDNFYEGIGMSNQRSLLITPETMQGGGTLTLQCGDIVLGVRRIKLQWLQNQNGLVSPEITDTLVTPAPEATAPAQQLNGQPAPADSPAWHGQLVNVPITATPQRIEQGVEFSVQLDNVPLAGRLAFKENGLSWNQRLVVWINQQRAGTVTPSVPDLADKGFMGDAATSAVYVGWRNGSIFVPVTLLKSGTNTIQLSVENDAASGNATPEASNSATLPLAVKDLVLQLSCENADDAPSPATASAADSSAGSTPGLPSPAPPSTNTP